MIEQPNPPILIFRLGSLGDAVIALPCFHKVFNSFGDRRKILLSNISISNLAISMDKLLLPAKLVDSSIEYPIGIRSVREIFNLRKKIITTGADTLIYLVSSRSIWQVYRDIFFFRLCGIRRIIGAPLTEDLLNCRVDPFTGSVEPEVERLTRTLSSLGSIDLANPIYWDLCLTSEEINTAAHFFDQIEGSKFIAINMGGKDPSKDWGINNWSELITRVGSEYPSLALVAVGANADFNRANVLLSLWPSKTLNLCGILTARECASFLSKAILFIGHDSGPLHLAASVQVSCIGLFGSFNLPRRWHPYGVKNIVIHEIKGIHNIRINQVIDSIYSILIKITSSPSANKQ